MTSRLLRGLGASAGIAVGRAFVLREDVAPGNGGSGPADAERALEALAAAAEELERAAARLRRSGLVHEAEILEAGALIASDPVLADDVSRRAAVLPAAQAVAAAIDEHANRLAQLDDPLLAARASDIRELGRRAGRILAGAVRRQPVGDDAVLVARDLGPGEVAELEAGDGRLVAIVLADGAATSHAAIMARALGVPMVVGLGPSLLELADGVTLIVDGDEGLVSVAPKAGARAAAAAAVRERERTRQVLSGLRGLAAETRDGRRLTLLCNASTAAEVAAGLAADAEGVGLLRTELAFLDAARWPTEEEHRQALGPPLALLAGRTATVRTLDFGADKTPPFLAGTESRGLALMLEREEALVAQLKAIADAGRDTRLRVLLPLVKSAEQVRAVRRLLLDARLVEGGAPLLGAMIETPEAVARASEIAHEADFLSIGTNDLVATTLGLGRETLLASPSTAADPEVLRLVAATVESAHEAGLTVEVCGEAAGELEVAVLLVGLGVDELSVAPNRVDAVRALVRGLDYAQAVEVGGQALGAASAGEALAAVRERLASGQAGHDRREALQQDRETV